MNALTLSSAIIVLAGFMAMMFRSYAEKHGWAIGSIWYRKEGWIGVLVWMAIIPGIVQLIYELGFLQAIGLGFLLLVVSPAFLFIFKSRAQYLIYLMVPVSMLIWIIGGAEIITV